MNAPRAGIPLRPDPHAVEREWRRSFTRAATATGLSRIQKTSAAEILRAWPNDTRAEMIVRGAVEPTKQSAPESRGSIGGFPMSHHMKKTPIMTICT